MSEERILGYNGRAQVARHLYAAAAQDPILYFDNQTTIEAQRMGRRGGKPGIGAALKCSLPKGPQVIPACPTLVDRTKGGLLSCQA